MQRDERLPPEFTQLVVCEIVTCRLVRIGTSTQNKIGARKRKANKVLKLFPKGRKKESTKEVAFGQELERELGVR